MTTKRYSFFYGNSLSLILIGFFLIFLIGQFFAGWHVYNNLLIEDDAIPIGFFAYLRSGHCFQATFENWESEFLQMYAYVLMTVYFRQKGSSESKPLDKPADVDREPLPHKDAPWPVKKGGIILKLYEHSLSLSFLFLFLLSFVGHAWGSYGFYKTEQLLENDRVMNVKQYIFSSRFWFESFQNWQSEFLAVLSIVLLSVFLRQKGSPESKPVDTPYWKND